MRRSVFLRLTALALCLCLLPALGLAETYLTDNEVTHVDFTARLRLHAGGFPADAGANLPDWESYLNKLSLRGSMNVLDLFQEFSRVYLDGAILLNGKDQLPFTFDHYYSYRYLLSPAIWDENFHFQMDNFLEFMLKPYYYYEWPTQYLGLLLYPDATMYIVNAYYKPLAERIAEARQCALNAAEEAAAAAPTPTAEAPTDANATPAPTVEPAPTVDPNAVNVSYDVLYQLCEDLDPLAYEDDGRNRAYNYFTSLLTQLGASDSTLDALSELETWLDFLDPEQGGLTVRTDGDTTTYTIGEYELLTVTDANGATSLHLDLPNAEGYRLTTDYAWTPGESGAALTCRVRILEDGADEASVEVALDGQGLPREGDLSGAGTVSVGVTGTALEKGLDTQSFAFSWNRTAAEKPYDLHASVDWLHPDTGMPALTVDFDGSLSTVDKSVFKDGAYSANDFFSLSEGWLEKYEETWFPAIGLYCVPFVLEAPAGVINDVIKFIQENEFDELLSLS